MNSWGRVAVGVWALWTFLSSQAHAQRAIRILERRAVQGATVKALSPGRITLASQGQELVCRIQPPGQQGLALSGAVINFPAKVEVEGEPAPQELRPGVMVRVLAVLNKTGAAREKLREIHWTNAASASLRRVEILSGDRARFEITAPVMRLRRGELVLQVGPNRWFRRRVLKFQLDPEAKVHLRTNDLDRVQPGDEVVQAQLVHFDTGDWAVQSIHIRLRRQGEGKTLSRAIKEEDRYARFSDEPRKPRDVRSAHFLLHTDISDRQARILLDKLETMYGLLVQYFRRQPRAPIRCYVVRQLEQWPLGLFPPEAVAKIQNKEGVTITRRLGDQVESIVYSCDRHGVVQHEAVHAFCALTFGSTGPTWYAEGLAELGNYWKKGQRAVDVPPVVITYLKTTRPRTLAEIVAPGQISGDSWQAYAWRWALCHMLMYNPNYSGRFRALGIGLMTQRPGVSFQSVYGSVAREISFEYDFFVKHVDNGFRADLVAWNWKARFRTLRRGAKRTVNVQAARGWQPTTVAVRAGQRFRYLAQGSWKLDALEAVSADGRPDGKGKLMGVLFANYELSEPFELGAQGTWTAPQDGWLYVRCRDSWSQLGDNSGSVRLTIQRVD